MANDKNDRFFELLIFIISVFGGVWLLNRILKQPKDKPGIFGFKFVRNLIPYIDKNGNELFKKDLEQLTSSELSFVLTHLIIYARTTESLSYPVYKPLKYNTKITGELRKNQFRIFLYKIDNQNYIMLSLFKKKTDETPKSEIERAENRINEYIGRNNK